MSDDSIRQLAKKFVEGQASEAEIAALLEWYAAHREDQTVLIDTDQPDLEEKIRARIRQQLQVRIQADLRNRAKKQERDSMHRPGALREMDRLPEGTGSGNPQDAPMIQGAGLGSQPDMIGSQVGHPGKPGDMSGKEVSRSWKPEDMPGRDVSRSGKPQDVGENLPARRIPMYQRRWTRAAAVILLLAGAAWWYQQTGFTHPANLVELSVPKQQRQRIVLPDGSEVWVNADSRLRYAQGFTASSREVWLEGEAFFDVKPDPARPFLVHTEHATTRVLGTSFDMKAYPNDKQASVTVLQGRVEVEDAHRHKRQLGQDQQALIDIAAGQLTDKTVAADSYQAWTRGAMEFNGENFDDVARILNRRFGVNIKFDNEGIGRCTFIATFDSTDTMEKIVSLLCKTNGNSYRIDSVGNQVVISGKTCN